MNKAIWITFSIALILGLSIGFILGIGTSIYAGASFVNNIIESKGITIVFDINETAAIDYAYEIVDNDIDLSIEDKVNDKIKDIVKDIKKWKE